MTSPRHHADSPSVADSDNATPKPKGKGGNRQTGEARKGGKKSNAVLQAEEGLERTDNGMKQTSWPEVGMINQKNYYT